MNERQRFHAAMHYQPVDRGVIFDFGFWDETLVVWREQGLPDGVDQSNSTDFFGMDRYVTDIKISMDLAPGFEPKVLEDRDDHEVFQQADGVRVLRRKFMGSIPQHLGHLLVDRDSWQQHYKPRLDPDAPLRYPPDFAERVKVWRDPNRDYPIMFWGGSLFGKLRDWMGIENVAMVIYDDPAWFEEMVTTMADCIIGTITRLLETGAQFDGCNLWEDMAYRSGPLISPAHYKKYIIPHYRRITDLLRRYGVDVVYVDCDGNIELLAPLWLEAGINCMFPIEIGTWGADPVAFRRQYGKDMLLMGGFDKRILARARQDIEQEVYRLLPLMEEGGFIGFCDHRVPPDVPLENYWYYLETVRRVWGNNLDNLRPMGHLVRRPLL